VMDSLLVRIENIKKTGFANEIIVEESEGQKFRDIKKYSIDIFTVGSDWLGAFDYLKDYCKVVYLDRTKNISSTMLRTKEFSIQRIGIIGTGRIADRFMPEAALVSGVDVQSVYNPHINSARAFARRWKIDVFEELEDFYQSTDIIYIASPHDTHYEYIWKALEHSKHVLCEMPMCLNREQRKDSLRMQKRRIAFCLKESRWRIVPALPNCSA